MEKTDEEIVKLIQENDDKELFGFLIDRYDKKIISYGRKFLKDKQDIEDIVQNIFIKVFVNIQSFDLDKKFSSWIYRIAHNEFVNELRKNQRKFFSLDFDLFLPRFGTDENFDNKIDEIDKGEFHELLEKKLYELDIKYREALILYFYEEMSYKEISEIMQIPVSTVGIRINRAKKILKNFLENENEIENEIKKENII
jgi:RNA polymerase sigma-70 factor, ECF subfamily